MSSISGMERRKEKTDRFADLDAGNEASREWADTTRHHRTAQTERLFYVHTCRSQNFSISNLSERLLTPYCTDYLARNTKSLAPCGYVLIY